MYLHFAGIFGDYTQNNVVVEAGKTTTLPKVIWKAESAGKELWRIGVPDKTSGKHRIRVVLDVSINVL